MQPTKTILSVFFSFLFVGVSNAQVDTIFTNNEKIPCIIKEVTPEAVKYTYEGEELLNSVFKNSIQKIKYKSGREQIFSEATFFKKIDSLDEYDNVTITQVESEVRGLFKIGEVSSKAKGTTTLSNQERVKERAFRKLKIQAAIQGANIIYITFQRSDGNKGGGLYQASTSAETSLTGVAYSNQLPKFEEFLKIVGERTNFKAVKESKLWSSGNDFSESKSDNILIIQKITNENGLILIEGDLGGSKYSKFRVVSFNNDSFNIYYEDKKTAYNIKLMF